MIQDDFSVTNCLMRSVASIARNRPKRSDLTLCGLAAMAKSAELVLGLVHDFGVVFLGIRHVHEKPNTIVRPSGRALAEYSS